MEHMVRYTVCIRTIFKQSCVTTSHIVIDPQVGEPDMAISALLYGFR